MGLKNFFSRRKNRGEVTTSTANHKVVCDTKELKDLITWWNQVEGWEFENFADFLELVGIRTPVKLSKNGSHIKCITALNTEVVIYLIFGDGIDKCSGIDVEEGEERRNYSINHNVEKGKTIPRVTLDGKLIVRGGKELSGCYNSYGRRCQTHIKLKLDDTHILKVEIHEPSKKDKESESFVLRNYTNFENYLLGLDESSLVVSQVYDSMVQLLALSDEDIFNSEQILISYIETADKLERVLSKILLIKGKMQEYAILEDGETFHVYQNGDWSYLSEGIKVVYLEEKKQLMFSVTGKVQHVTNVNPSEIMSLIEKRNSELWKFVK